MQEWDGLLLQLSKFIIICLTTYDLSVMAEDGDGDLAALIACSSNNSSNSSSTSSSSMQVILFHCGSHECIRQEFRCNGVPDCADGSDEAVRECGCLPNEYQCGETCIDNMRLCDTRIDCVDAADEANCETYACPVGHFKCNNHFCVPSEHVCDFHDHCGDGSDEQECHHRECWKAEFECSNGQCIRPGRICDGVAHCKDATDEVHCLPEDFAVCGSGARVHRYYWCDGWPDCRDNHADELHCGECDPAWQFQCPNSRCVTVSNLCDAICDCVPDCADEANCTHLTYTLTDGVKVCEVGSSMSCSVASLDRVLDRCITLPFLCDGRNDCHNGGYLSDESGCGEETCGGGDGNRSDWFSCSDGRCLPPNLHCDHKYDCLHGDDELNCSRPECQSSEWQCRSGQCIPAAGRCDLTYQCHDKSDEVNCGTVSCGADRRCDSGQCVKPELWCDWLPDCPDASDEAHCERRRECRLDELRCASGQCVPLRYKCDASVGPRQACADSSHLLNCSKERCGPGLFQCGSGPCLPPSMLCDGEVQCPLTWDDEDNCPFSCSASAPYCECRDISISCLNQGMTSLPSDIEPQISRFHLAGNYLNHTLDISTFLPYRHIVFLDLSNNSLSTLPAGVFLHLSRLRILDLRHNYLRSVANSTFLGLVNLKTLHLSGNAILALEGWALYGLSSLTTLEMSQQGMRNVSCHAFVGLRSLLNLNLSNNQLSHLSGGAFSGLSTLLSLDLRHNQLSVMDPRVFSGLTSLHHLWTDEFRFCCLAREVGWCHPPPDEFSSCEDLMTNSVLRVCVWVLGFIALLGNSFVIVWRLLYANDNKVHSFLITNLALGDLCMGLYLLIIAAVDIFYRGVYFIYDAFWRTSSLCQLAGFFSTFSSELSVFTLTVITLERLVVIVFPFRVPRLSMRWTKVIMGVVWVCVAFLAALPLADIHYFRNFYGRSGVCLALHITHEKPSGWQYSVFLFLVLNLASFSVIAGSYWGMYRAARTSSAAVRSDLQRRETSMARKMTLIVVTDAACWLPIILLGVVSLAGVTIPPQVFAWVAVFVLPLNAAINPLLYTVSTAPFLSKARERALNVRSSFRWSISRRATNSSTGTAVDDRTTVVKPTLTLGDLDHTPGALSTLSALHLLTPHVNHLNSTRGHQPRRSQSLHGTVGHVVAKRNTNEEWAVSQREIIPLCELTNHTHTQLSRQLSRKKHAKHHHELYD
ncbi:G-protein coupled receptor GRL101 isoform X2 [Cherax quadricarinatus]|uniref:G-protein coupled receptor GRL101 isoform X2 n=1 Tax=Cherax quadricarinatus TaxID=27406 RepID=UPI00387E22DD